MVSKYFKRFGETLPRSIVIRTETHLYTNTVLDGCSGAYPGFRQGGGESVKTIIRSKIYNLGKNDR